MPTYLLALVEQAKLHLPESLPNRSTAKQPESQPLTLV
jgi:hypothetical protein